MELKIILLFVSSIFAFWMSAICGGGASLILIPILNLAIPTSVVPFSLTVGTFASSASRIVVFKKYIKWRIFLWFVPFSIPAVLAGAYLIKYINPIYLQVIVAIVLISNLPELFISRKQQTKEEKPYPNFILAFVGFFAGFVSGITGAIGLLFNKFYLRYGLTKEEIVATRAANEIFLHFIKLIIYILLGLYSKAAIWLGITIAVSTVVSSFSVKYILPYLSEYMFRKIGYSAMVISGFILLVSTTKNIIRQDHIAIYENSDNTETTIKWRQSDFVLEYTLKDGLEIERPIKADELPPVLKTKYDSLRITYDAIHLEKIFKYNEKNSYEFYCYKNRKLINKEEFKVMDKDDD